jgi:hypothetical protein
MKSILIIEPPSPLGGVKTLIKKVCSALKMENLYVTSWAPTSLITPSFLLNYHLNDLLRYVRQINFYDVIMYFGSIVGLGHIIDNLRKVPVTVFISGHPIYEFSSALRDTALSIRTRTGALLNLSYNRLTYLTDIVDLWICHTLTVCEEIGVIEHGNYALLKQFVLPSEVNYYGRLVESAMNSTNAKNNKHVQVFSYLSYANLPGLKLDSLIRIFNHVRRLVTKDVRFIIEDPKARGVTRINDFICVVGRMPWDAFLNTLAVSDLYIETAIDEELRFTSLDAALLKVPIAKITAPAFFDRQDYTSDDIIVARSIREFVNLITEYINKIDYYKQYYSKNVYNFTINKRSWNTVKNHFMTALLSLMK